jgi:hypothetical protein
MRISLNQIDSKRCATLVDMNVLGKDRDGKVVGLRNKAVGHIDGMAVG